MFSITGVAAGGRAAFRSRRARQVISFACESLEIRQLLSFNFIGVPNWIEQGPASISNAGITAAPGNRVGGAIEAIAVSPSDAVNTVFVGTVAGGVWRSTNFSSASPNWTPLTDQLDSLYVGSIAFDPSNSNTLYVGTGSFSNTFRNQLSQTAVGLYRTTNANATNPTWVNLDRATFNGLPIRRVLPTTDPNIILVAADDGGGNGGIFRSINGGQNFTPITNGVILPNGTGSDLIADPNNATRYYAAMSGVGVFRSDDRGANWQRIDNRNTAITGIGASNNIELAVHDAGATTVLYVGVVGGSVLSGVFRDTAGGDGTDNDAANGTDDVGEYNWAAIGAAPAIHGGSQGFNNFAIVADPTNANMVYVSGDRPPEIFRGNAGDGSWTSIVGGGAQGGTGPHADSRFMVFQNNNTLLESDDGGIYRLSNPLDATNNSWTNVNGDLRNIEFHSIAYDTQNNTIFGGTQDNGSDRQSGINSTTWNLFQGGDGSTQAFDSNDNTAYSLGNNFGSFTRGYGATQLQLRAAVGGAANFDGLENTSGGGGDDRTFATTPGFQSFLPVVANRFTAGRLLLARRGLYESTDHGDTITTINLPGKGAQDVVRSLVYGGSRSGTNSDQVFWAGTQAGRLYVRDNAGTITDVTANLTATVAAGFIKGIAVDPQDWQRAFVVVGNRVAQTIDGGANFTEITNNLGNISSELRRIDLVDTSGAAGDGVVVVGGLGGMFRRLGTTWTEYGFMPQTLVHDTHFVNVDQDANGANGTGLLLAGTFGRGAWSVPNVTATISTAGVLQVIGDSNANAMSLMVDPNNSRRILVSDGAGNSASFESDLFQSIQFQGLGNDDTLTVDFANGNPIPAGGLSFDGGGGGDRLVLQNGTFTNETYTATGPGSGTINLDGTIINFSNLAPIDDTLVVSNLIFNTTASADVINFQNGPVIGTAQTDQIASGGTFESLNFANKTNVTINGQNGADTLNLSATVAASGLSSLRLNGEDAANAGDDLASDTFNITAGMAGVSLAGNGGGGADSFNISGMAAGTTPAFNGQDGDDLFTVTGSSLGAGTLNLNGNSGNDQFFMTSSANTVINVDGGTQGSEDLLSMNGESLDYTISASAFTAAGRQSLNYINVEALNLASGSFGVPGSINPRVSVDQDAKLYGDGTVLNVVGATLNGIISPGLLTGSATGILNTGSVTFAATSSYQIQVNGLLNGIEHDVLNVSGTVSLGGANLDMAVTLTLVPGDEVMILHNDGVDPIVGKFAQGDMITVGTQKFAIDYAYDGDGDGNLNDVAIIRYGAALAPDPCEPGVLALFVSATTGADNIRLIPDNGNHRIHAFINSDDFGVFETKGLILAFGQSGNDTILNAMPAHKSWLYGQGGNDTVTSGNQDSILMGGIGNDLLTGGNGKDILIGGKGADVLAGGNGDDILISSASAYETNNAANRKALCGIQDEWIHGNGGPKERMDHLTNGGGANGTAVFNATTLFEDSSVDSLFGQNGKDWLVMNSSGGGVLDLSDAGKNDVVTDL